MHGAALYGPARACQKTLRLLIRHLTQRTSKSTALCITSVPVRERRFDPLWNSLVVGGIDHEGQPFLGTVGMIGTAYTDDHVATGALALPTMLVEFGICFRAVRNVTRGTIKGMSPCACAGFGNYLARPLFRERHSRDMSEADATKLLQDALRVRFSSFSCCLLTDTSQCRESVMRRPHPVVHLLHTLHAACAQVCYYRDKQSINKFKLATVTSAGVKITEPFALETKWDFKVCTERLAWRLYELSHCSCCTLL